jgi:hypothetical protein
MVVIGDGNASFAVTKIVKIWSNGWTPSFTDPVNRWED